MGNALDFDIYLDSFLWVEWGLEQYPETPKNLQNLATIRAKTIHWAREHKGRMSDAEALAKVEELRTKYHRVHANDELSIWCESAIRMFLT